MDFWACLGFWGRPCFSGCCFQPPRAWPGWPSRRRDRRNRCRIGCRATWSACRRWRMPSCSDSFGSRVILPGFQRLIHAAGPAGAPKEHGRDAGDAGAGGRAGRPDRAGFRRRPAPGDGRAGGRRAAGARRPVRAVECAAVCGIRRHIRIHGARLLAPLQDQEAAARKCSAPCPMRWICSPSAWRRAWRSSRRSCEWARSGTTRCRANSAVPWRRCGWG